MIIYLFNFWLSFILFLGIHNKANIGKILVKVKCIPAFVIEVMLLLSKGFSLFISVWGIKKINVNIYSIKVIVNNIKDTRDIFWNPLLRLYAIKIVMDIVIIIEGVWFKNWLVMKFDKLYR